MRVFRRDDVAAVRITPQPDEPPRTLRIAHIDLYFFYDTDVVLLNVEVYADNLRCVRRRTPCTASAAPTRAAWDDDGHAMHCAHRVEWLGRDGEVLAVSDFERREKYLAVRLLAAARRALRRIGRSCCGRWCSISPTKAVRCASG